MLNEYLYKVIKRIRSSIQYNKNIKEYNQINDTSFTIEKKYMYPCLLDRYENAGEIKSYFWQDLWCAQLIFKQSPNTHYDIGSRIDGFIGHLASFRSNITLIDIRPLTYNIPGVSFIQADATTLNGIEDNSISSISALCSLEHFGLGRYGDPIDPHACFKAFNSIKRVLSHNGHAYISVPIGYEHLEYDAHRIFYPSTIINEFCPLKLVEFSTTYNNEIIYNDSITLYDNEKDNRGDRFGLFHFVKE